MIREISNYAKGTQKLFFIGFHHPRFSWPHCSCMEMFAVLRQHAAAYLAKQCQEKKKDSFYCSHQSSICFFLSFFSYFYTALSMSLKTYLFFIIIVVLCSFTETILSPPGFVNIVKKSAKDTDTWFYDCKGDNSQNK